MMPETTGADPVGLLYRRVMYGHRLGDEGFVGPFCGHRVDRVLEGKPLIMCGRKEEVGEILASLSRR